jgi:tetratricopeptide (TPR) repeat protein
MAGFDQPDERLAHEAEELMRQRRYQDAAARYGDLLERMPTDLWATLGRVSALECAGQLDEARTLLERLGGSHRRSASFQRFRHLFFVRREDFSAASASQRALQQGEVVDEGQDDQLADLYFNQGRYHEAAGELERLLAAGVEDGELKASVMARLGACQRQLGDATTARGNLVQALALEPGNHWTLSELAEAERALGDSEAARRRYREALEAAPDDHWTRGHLAQLEFENGDAPAAIKLYEEILFRDPHAAWAHVELAQVLADTNPTRSRELCAKALDLDPRNPWAHAQLGSLARREGNWSEARDHFQRAHQGAPSAAWVLHELADSLRNLGKRDEGYAALQRALEEDPYHAITYGYLADFLRHDGRDAEALTHLAKALELDPAYAWAWRERAELTALAGRYAEAEEGWKKACELEPDAAINDGLKAFILRCQGRRLAALPWLERAVERQPNYLWAWRERLEHLLAEGRPADAVTVGVAAVEALPDAASLRGMLAEARRRLVATDPTQRAQAAADVTRAIELDAAIPQLWAIRAELAVERGDLAEAESAARRAVELAEQHRAGPEYLALLSQVLVACDRPAEAEALLQPLLVAGSTLQPVWELAAVLAERRGDLAGARDLCDRALAGSLAGEPRLTVRRARLGILLGEDAKALALKLDLVFTADARVVPWRDAAQVLAQGGRPVEARRAAYLALELAEAGAPLRRARVHLAEVELALGNPAGSAEALDAVLAEEPDHLQARILGAALADHRGDVPAAIQHLQRLDGRIRALLQAHDPKAARDPEPMPPLLRQLAALYERSGDLDLADQVLQRLVRSHPADGEILAERALFLVRRDGAEASRAAIDAALAAVPSGTPARQRLIRELALAVARHGSAAPALALLLRHEAELDLEGRLLLARLALSAGEPAVVIRHLVPRPAGFDAAQNDTADLLLARAHLAAGAPDLAEALASGLWLRHSRANEDAAAVFAECHACRGRFSEALEVLADPALPAAWSLERALLGGVVALEERGEAWALSCLGRHGAPSAEAHRLPLVRLFAAAWPGAWCQPLPAQPATPGDLASMPPFPRAAERLAAALIAAGRADLAAMHFQAVLNFHRRHGLSVGTPAERRLRRLACQALVAAHCRWAAAGLALRGGNLRGLLAAVLPTRR